MPITKPVNAAAITTSMGMLGMLRWIKAVVHQKKALELKPELANGYFGLAMAYEKMGKKTEAIANWKEFSKLAQPHSKWWMTAQEHIQALEGKTPATPKK